MRCAGEHGSPSGNSEPAAESALIRRHLLDWYDRNARALPWRASRDPYAIWLSEVMLQQTRVETVLAFHARFLLTLPTLRALADAPEEQVLKLWEGLGYYRRARNLHRAAKEIVALHGGKLPGDYEALLALPGFGKYTAGAVASIAFGLAYPAVDGNVKRVLSRLCGVRVAVDGAEGERAVWECAGELLDRERPGDWNQALMELGAVVCTPSPKCELCPLEALCDARRAGDAQLLPVRAAKREKAVCAVGVALVTDGSRVLVVRRPEDGLLAGLWVFPLEECLAGEELAAAKRAALGALAAAEGRSWEGESRQRTHSAPEALPVCTKLCEARHVFTHRVWKMAGYGFALDVAARDAPGHSAASPDAFGERSADGDDPNGGSSAVPPPAPQARWATREELRALMLPTAMRAYRQIADHLLGEGGNET